MNLLALEGGHILMEACLESRLHYDKERYHLLLTHLDAITYEYDIAKDIMVFSETKRPHDKLCIEQYREKLFTVNRNLVHADFFDKLLAIYTGQNCKSQEVLIDFPLKPQGKFYWYEITSQQIQDDAGKITHTIGVMWNVDERMRECDTLRFRSEQDPLTGLYNRAGTEKAIDLYLSGKGGQVVSALLLLDIDNFQQINDTRGSHYGDQVLNGLSKEIKKLFRCSDILGRVGGSRFIVLMKDISEIGIVDIKAGKLSSIFNGGNSKLYAPDATCSVGAAIYPQNGASYTELLEYTEVKIKEKGLKLKLVL